MLSIRKTHVNNAIAEMALLLTSDLDVLRVACLQALHRSSPIPNAVEGMLAGRRTQRLLSPARQQARRVRYKLGRQEHKLRKDCSL